MMYLKIQYIINTISPVFIVIILGSILRLSGFIKTEVAESLNKLTYWIALPALLFYSVATTSYHFKDAVNIFYVICGGMLAAVALSTIISLLFSFSRPNAAAFVQGAFRGNLIFIGLPLVVYSLEGTKNAQKLEQLAILSLSMIIPVYNLMAIIILSFCKHDINLRTPLRLLKALVTNPLIIAALCGLLYKQLGLDIPTAMDRTLQIVGRLALPLSLLCIGGSLVSTRSSSDYSSAFVASIIKTVFCPICGFYIAQWLGLAKDQATIALLFLVCPTAATSYIMASQMGANSRLAAAIIFISTVISVFAIVGVLMLI